MYKDRRWVRIELYKIEQRNYDNDIDGRPQDGKKLLIMWRKKEQASTRQCHTSRDFVLVYLTIKIKCTHKNRQNWTSTLRQPI